MHSMKKASQYQTFTCGENWVARGMNMYILHACGNSQIYIYIYILKQEIAVIV